MKRKICTMLTVLAISATLAGSASAARFACSVPDCGGLPILCLHPGWQQSCPDTDCPDTGCPEEPSVPNTPAQPDEPSEPEAPSVPDQSGVLTEESAVLTLVNDIRAQYGLSPLTLDAELCRYARVKSQDMHDVGYFSHESPTYVSPFDMMRSFGLSYAYAGENIAKGYGSAEAVVNAWMNSSRHRANILSANFTRLGDGYVADGGYWTQWFLG